MNEFIITGEILNASIQQLVSIIKTTLNINDLELIENGNVIDYEGVDIGVCFEPSEAKDTQPSEITQFLMTASYTKTKQELVAFRKSCF